MVGDAATDQDLRLGVEQMPDISFPGAFIEVRYPGAAPEAVEPPPEAVEPPEAPPNSTTAFLRGSNTAAESTSARKRSAAAGSAVTMQSLWREPKVLM